MNKTQENVNNKQENRKRNKGIGNKQGHINKNNET